MATNSARAPSLGLPRQRRLLELCDERARRLELLAALITGGGVDPRGAMRVLGSSLSELEESAEGTDLEPLASMVHAARQVVEQYIGLPRDDGPRRDVLVLDDNEVTRDLISLAIEAEGHSVRVSASLSEFLHLFRERKPDVILTEARMPNAPEDQFCDFLRKTIATEAIPIVIFSSAQGAELATLALNAGADLYLSKEQGIADLTRQLNQLFEEIVW
jgi:CheY-like chemotaxis protein